MSPEFWGQLSGLLVMVSAIPYIVRVYQRKIEINLTSWILWTIIGLCLMLTYLSAGATANAWPAMFGFSNPLIVVILAIVRGEKIALPNKGEAICALLAIWALVMWWYTKDDPSLAQYALYLSIIADSCAAIPTIIFVWNAPEKDRPFAWGAYAVAYGIALLAITEHTVANYVLPLYMLIGPMVITTPLVLHRIRHRMHWTEWI